MIDQYLYDDTDWLVSTTRALYSYLVNLLGEGVTVESSYPDVHSWTKETPLAKPLVHIDQDDMPHVDPLGFGVPGIDVTDDAAGTVSHQEIAWHLVSFDIGIWVSPEAGGSTERMQIMQKLKNAFSTATGRQDFVQTTQGVKVVSFDGGRNELDRINDLPVWRALDLMLVVRVFSRHVPAVPDTMLLDFTVDEDLTITSEDGTLVPIADTDE